MATEAKTATIGASVETSETSLVDQILTETRIAPNDDAYGVAKRGVQAFITELLAPGKETSKIDKALVDAMIGELDKKISRQLDEVLHAPSVQKLESAWRGLKFTVDRTDFRENIKVDMLNVSKDDLIADFEDASDTTKSGLYRTCYTAEYGTFGGKPYGAVFANFEVTPAPQDIELLRSCASVAAMSHAPFFAAANPKFFGETDMRALPALKDLKAIFEGPQYAKWNSFRDTDDSRSVGLVLPRFLLRLPYGPETVPVKRFNYQEDAVEKHDAYLWGNATFALATRVADSFAKFRWCPNIIGPQAGGAVENLPLHQYQNQGELQTKTPTEVALSERREFELSEEGFIALTYRKDSDNAAFFSANSVQRPKTFGISPEGKEAELNFRLGTQLPYLFIVNRIAHYVKVIQREEVGSTKDRGEVESSLNTWLSQYVVDQEGVSAYVRGVKPLRSAQIKVSDVPGNAGFYKVEMHVKPHFKYMGASFTLSLVGKLDKT